MNGTIKDLAGRKFNFLTVLEQAGRSPSGGVMWLCLCDCGEQTRARGCDVSSGRIVSCGCYGRRARREAATTHGKSGTPEYFVWNSMRMRCEYPRTPEYPNYGGRGITVCDRWRDFVNFFEDMGECPPGHSLDRINNDGNYEPGNCRWATAFEQNRNKRGNAMYTHEGITLCLTDWARRSGFSDSKVIQRRLRRGWSFAQAISTPVDPRKQNNPRRRPNTSTPAG